MQEYTSDRPGSIEFYSGGVAVNAPSKGNKKKKGGAVRGRVQGWSSASRRRFREFMLSWGPPESFRPCGFTFTIPGPPLPVPVVKKLWGDWCRRAQAAGWGVVWRLEVQQRGAVHWHGLCYLPVEKDGRVHLADVCLSWEDALRRLGPFDYSPPLEVGSNKNLVYHVESLMCIPGANLHAVDVRSEGGSGGAWRRYLQDHASKSKQDQIAQGLGRHWGVVGRKHFQRVLPSSVSELSNPAFFAFLRAFQRLCTPVVKAPGSPFGRRLGYRIRRGSLGRSVWYSSTVTVARLVEWASALHSGATEAS